MEILKRGSEGESVKTLQKALGIADDGIFGRETEKAVKVWQAEHGLVSDGIVGSKTWASLIGIDKEDGIDITPAYINTHITKAKNRQVKYIAVHYTAGGSSKAGSAKAVRNVFLQPKRRASADFVVDDHEIVQINPDLNNYYCWGVGDKKNPYTGGGTLYGMATNRNTVSIEICSNLKKGYDPNIPNHEGWYFTDAALKNALKLIRYLIQVFGLSKYAVVRHYDVSGKICPGIVGWNDAMIYSNDGKKVLRQNNSDEWQKFWAQI